VAAIAGEFRTPTPAIPTVFARILQGRLTGWRLDQRPAWRGEIGDLIDKPHDFENTVWCEQSYLLPR
jgi:hypothetical protein